MWVIMTKDATDEFRDVDTLLRDDDNTDLHDVTFYDKFDEAKKQYKAVAGIISNVYLMKVIEKEVCI